MYKRTTKQCISSCLSWCLSWKDYCCWRTHWKWLLSYEKEYNPMKNRWSKMKNNKMKEAKSFMCSAVIDDFMVVMSDCNGISGLYLIDIWIGGSQDRILDLGPNFRRRDLDVSSSDQGHDQHSRHTIFDWTH